MKKIFALALAILMILPFAVACGQVAAPEDSSTEAIASSAEPQNSSAPDETTEYAPLGIPDSLKYTGTTVKILHWNAERPEFEVEAENGEPINDAIWKKNARTEEQLGITLEWTETKGDYNNQAAFVNTCANANAAGGDDVFDVFAGYSLTAATIMLQGLSQNLGKYEVLDLSKPWWPESLTSQAMLGNKFYYVSGDISSNVLHMMYCCVFNKDLLEEVHGKDVNMYDIVENGQWTLDKLFELSKGVYRDENGNNEVDYGDRFGFQSIDLHFDCFFNGSGLKNLEAVSDKEIKISPDFTSQKSIDLSAKLCKFLFESGDAWGKGTTSKDSSSNAFGAGLALFITDRAYCTTFAALRDSNLNYGILPVPKYDENQTKHITCMAFPYTIYSMSAASQHGEATAAMLQVMGYYCYTEVTPALFEISMKAKYAKEYADARMFDIIRENVYFDLGRIFTTPCANCTYYDFRSCVHNNQGDTWATMSKTAGKQMNTKLKDVNKSLAKLGD